MKNFFLGFWHGVRGSSTGFDWSANWLGALGLTIMLSQKAWNEWLNVEKACLYFLTLLVLFSYEGWYLVRRLRRTNRSVLWILPLMLPLIGLAGPPKWGHPVHVYFLVAFIVLQLPLFVDLYFMRKERN